MTYVRIGSDPETFLRDAAGKYISSVGLIGGSKDEPMPIGNGCSVQEDNVTVESNTPPTNDPQEFVNAINYGNRHFAIFQVIKAHIAKPNHCVLHGFPLFCGFLVCLINSIFSISSSH